MSRQQLGILGGLATTVMAVFGCLGMLVCCALLPLALEEHPTDVTATPTATAFPEVPPPVITDTPISPSPTLEPAQEQPTASDTPPPPTIAPTPQPPTFTPMPEPPTPTPTPEPPTLTSTPQPPTATPTPGRTQARVTQIVDGDTIEVEINGGIHRLRYIGIDCPEPGQQGWYEASEANRQLVEGQIVWLEKDVSETDRYGRLLRYVYVGDLFVNAELVRLGYAVALTYPPDVQYADLFVQLEQEARAAERGLWAPPSPAPPSEPTWNCIGNLYNCDDFSSCDEVMSYWTACPGDPSRLDGDNDGVPCESLCR
jgi:micrococcal nuclease